MKSLRLSRRTVLRGAGSIAIALPWLEAMEPERVSSAAPVPTPARRFVAVYQPGGTVLEHFTPTGTESSPVLSPILAPLEPVKSELIVLSGVDIKSGRGGTDTSGMVAWLTGTASNQPSSNVYGGATGPSVDQVIAERIRGTQPFASYGMGVRWGTGRCHGMVCGADIVSYANDAPFSPMAPRLDIAEIWSELFGGRPPDDAAWDRSILDAVHERYTRLSARLGAEDRQRLEQHIMMIRELEQRIATVTPACSPPPLATNPEYNPKSGLNSADDGSIKDLPTDTAIPMVGRVMMDMLVMALACDITPVATFQWTDTECKHTLPWLGLGETHRFYMNDGGYRPAECERIATWYSEQHAYLLGQMARIDMGGHSLLDESVVFIGSHLQNPANYNKTDMPFLLAGRGGGLRTGRWLKYTSASHNDLLLALANLFGDPRTSFGDPNYSTGPLANLT